VVSTASVYFGGARRHDVYVAWLVYADVELFLCVNCVQATDLPPVRVTCVPRTSTREHALPPRVFKTNPNVTCSACHSSYTFCTQYSTLSVRGLSATEHSSLLPGQDDSCSATLITCHVAGPFIELSAALGTEIDMFILVVKYRW